MKHVRLPTPTSAGELRADPVEATAASAEIAAALKGLSKTDRDDQPDSAKAGKKSDTVTDSAGLLADTDDKGAGKQPIVGAAPVAANTPADKASALYRLRDLARWRPVAELRHALDTPLIPMAVAALGLAGLLIGLAVPHPLSPIWIPAAAGLFLFGGVLEMLSLHRRQQCAAKDLAASRRLVKAIAHHASAAILHCDPAGTPVWANAAWRDFARLGPDEALDGMWLSRLNPADAVQFDLLWSRVQITKEDAELEVSAPHPAGSENFALSIHALVEGQRCIGFLVTLDDITSRRRNAEALERSERLYRLVAENSRDIILRLDLEAKVLFASSAADRVLGHAPAALSGQSIRPLVHGHDWPVFTHVLSDLLIGSEPPELRFRLRHADGRWRWVEAMFQLVYDRTGHPREMIATLRDIHRRQLTEDMMTESAAKLRDTNRLLTLAEELAGVAHWRFSFADGGFDHGHQLYRMLGQVPGRLIEARTLLRHLDPAMRSKLFNAVREARRRRSSVECSIHFAVGEDQRHARLALQAERDTKGQVVGLIGITSDITEERRARREMIDARDAARAAASGRAQFLATMSHEIRTPMTGVIGIIDLLRDNPDARARAAHLETLSASAQHLLSILDEILDFSRLDGGHLELAQADFRVETLVAELIDLYAPGARAKGIGLRLEEDIGAPLPACGDPQRLRQVLSNLLSNAIKFTEAGEVVVELSRRSRIDEQCWTIAVRDSGIGMAPTAIPALFEPFAQADDSLSRPRSGTGLGLAIAQRIAKVMGGDIAVESAPRQGSCFTLTLALPVGEEPAVATTRASAAPSRLLDLLVAEDNAVNQMLIRTMLGARGHRVTCVGDGLAAVDAVRGGYFDAVVMDMQMPEMDGIAATRQIRGIEGARGKLPIIALSADASPERRRFYDNAGLDAFLTKPIDRDALLATIETLVGARDGDKEGEGSPPRVAGDVPGKAAKADERATDTLLDHDRLDALDSALGATRLDNLLGLLRVELELRPAQIERAIEAGDFTKLASEAHILKGAAASAGACRVAKVAARLEGALGERSARTLLADLDHVAEATLGAVEEERAARQTQAARSA
ncbi:ATP-binding protein [Sphingomicrobium arenosum]|uniref:ATP-binding protein n=1 Tax=Sphingomicrobium arenosum TaxID=2233861 RepID=UPI002240ED45|nr:ATP-binding protein [Sphingomicrobium arenosum]